MTAIVADESTTVLQSELSYQCRYFKTEQLKIIKVQPMSRNLWNLYTMERQFELKSDRTTLIFIFYTLKKIIPINCIAFF